MKTLFPGYYRPTEDEFAALWRNAVFVLDANILLHIYRFSAPSRERLFLLIEKWGDRMWVTHQAALEFHRNRLDAIRQTTKLYSEVREALRKVDEVVQKHRIHPYRDEVEAALHPAIATLGKALDTTEAAHPNLLSDDPYLDHLTLLLEGKVGTPFKSEELKKRLQEAKARTEANMPPGFIDARRKKDMPAEERYGDVILWFQIIEHAKANKKPIILVTDDAKEDWWRKHEGKTLGPLPELVNEFKEETEGLDFYLYTSERFMVESAKLLDLEPLPATVREAKAVREELYDYALAKASDEERRMFKAAKAMAEQSSCTSHLKQLGLAARQFVADFGSFPDARVWRGNLQSYSSRSLEELHILSCPSSSLPYGYAMNIYMSEVDLGRLREPEKCVLFFDCNLGIINAAGTESDLPFPPRHVEGNAICFADGHVQVVSQKEQGDLIWRPEFD